MAAIRKTPAPSNTFGAIEGDDYTEAVNEEIKALWANSCVPLSSVAGDGNTITAVCDVTLDQLKKGQSYYFKPNAPNTSSAVTLAISPETGKAIVNRDGSLPAIGRLQTSKGEILYYNGAQFELMLAASVEAEPRVICSAICSLTGSSGTYVRAGNVVTVTQAGHGFDAASPGKLVTITPTSGGIGGYTGTITVLNSNQFSYVDSASGATSGNLNIPIKVFRSYKLAGLGVVTQGRYNFQGTFPTWYFVNAIGGNGLNGTGNTQVLVCAPSNLATGSFDVIVTDNNTDTLASPGILSVTVFG